MRSILVSAFLPLAASFLPVVGTSQTCSSLNLTHQADIPSTCNAMVVTMMHDELNRPYLYVANKEAGLTVYDISAVASPTLAATVPVTQYGSLEVMNLDQEGNYLYLALGNSFAASQSGVAIVDVTNPAAPSVTDFWVLANSTSGGGIVRAEGNYAYFGAMGHGLVVLDISNKSNIQFVSRFVPDKYFPPIANPDTTKINARGMEVKNGIVYLCHDAGGLRVINCTNPAQPRETGNWCNPVMYTPINRPRAYNNIVIDDTLAYLAVDYCGMEVVNIKDTSNITLVGWWNPYNCPNNNWFSSPVHANEIWMDKSCRYVFLSTGKSDMIVVDVSDPTQPDSCNFYGGVSNNIGTWGAGLWQNQIYLSYICTLGIPFASNWTGIKILTYSPCAVGVSEIADRGIQIFPNPVRDQATISSDMGIDWASAQLFHISGAEVEVKVTGSGKSGKLQMENLAPGVYFLKLNAGGREYVKVLTKE